MLQFSPFDQLFPQSLPIMLEVFHIILTKLKLVEITKYKTNEFIKRYIMQHDRRFRMVVQTAGMSIT